LQCEEPILRISTIQPLKAVPFLLLAALLAGPSPVDAAERESYTLTIKNNRFDPVVLRVPSDRKLKLVIRNLDPTPEEFESYSLNREKVVSGNGTITVYVGPLKPGTYKFFGDFHQDTAQGRLVAE